MPSQQHEQDSQGASGVALSPSESINVGKRKAPDDGFGDQEQICCPCGAGSCPLLQSNKARSKGRQYYVCPKDQAERCGFFQWQDQAAHKQPNQGQRDDRGDLETEADSGRKVQCACGLPATELTSHSAKNPNRVFYKCGNQGQCRFFQWQDELPLQPAAQTPAPAEAQSHHISQQSPEDVLKQLAEPAKPATAAGGSGVFADDADDWGPQDVNDFNSAHPTAWMEGHNYANTPAPRQGGNQSANPLSPGHADPPMQIECSCKLQCTYMMAKTQKNDGRWFYRCPRRDEGQCKFFKWEDDAQQQPTSNGGAPYGAQSGAMPTYQSYASPPKIGAGAGGGSTGTCFKCGETGHWARDCPGGGNGGGGYNAGGGGYSAGPAGGSGSGAPCFKCGQEGHWARDCPSSGGGRGGAGGRSSYGRSGGGRGGGGRTGSSAKGSSTGACYKCGQSGHFSSACPN